MRTEEWTQDQEGMISTAVVDVHEAGDTYPPRAHQDMVVIRHEVFAELMQAAGYTHAGS